VGSKNKVVDILGPLVRHADAVPGSQVARSAPELKGMDELVSYQRNANAEDAANQAPLRPKDVVDQQVAAAEAEGLELERKINISADWSEVRYSSQGQAIDAAEYQDRVAQLTRADYSHNARMESVGRTGLGLSHKDALDIPIKNEEWLASSRVVTEQALSGRAGAKLRDFASTGAYTRRQFGDTGPLADEPMVFYHVDLWKDPTNRLPLIQMTDDAAEGGLHVGSRMATEELTTGSRQSRKNFDEAVATLNEFDPKTKDVFLRAVEEAKVARFRRTGDPVMPLHAREEIDSMVDEIFENFDTFMRAGDPDGPAILALDTADKLKSRLKGLLRADYDNARFPLVTDVKQGLVMPDIQNWEVDNIADNLIGMKIFPDDELEAIKQMGTQQGNKRFKELMAEKGYDHIAYHNGAEDSGTLSLVLFNDNNYRSLYQPSAADVAGAGNNAAYSVMFEPLERAIAQFPETVKQIDFIGQNNLEQVAAISQNAIPRNLRVLNDPKSTPFAKEQAQEKLGQLADDMRNWGARAMKNGATEQDVRNAQKGILPEPPTPLTEADVMERAGRNAEVVSLDQARVQSNVKRTQARIAKLEAESDADIPMNRLIKTADDVTNNDGIGPKTLISTERKAELTALRKEMDDFQSARNAANTEEIEALEDDLRFYLEQDTSVDPADIEDIIEGITK
jgi:hypothetical protein